MPCVVPLAITRNINKIDLFYFSYWLIWQCRISLCDFVCLMNNICVDWQQVYYGFDTSFLLSSTSTGHASEVNYKEDKRDKDKSISSTPDTKLAAITCCRQGKQCNNDEEEEYDPSLHNDEVVLDLQVAGASLAIRHHNSLQTVKRASALLVHDNTVIDLCNNCNDSTPDDETKQLRIEWQPQPLPWLLPRPLRFFWQPPLWHFPRQQLAVTKGKPNFLE